MLRITIHRDEAPPRFQLEGKLAEPWIVEAENAWREASGQLWIVDLAGVTGFDEAGRKLLEAMNAAGANFIAEGVKMRALVTELKSGGMENSGTRARGKGINRK